jgi:hypothetical protein
MFLGLRIPLFKMAPVQPEKVETDLIDCYQTPRGSQVNLQAMPRSKETGGRAALCREKGCKAWAPYQRR